MAGNNEAKAKYCYNCKKEACKGDCKKCPKRLEGDCNNLFFIVAHMEGNRVYYEWWCADCWVNIFK